MSNNYIYTYGSSTTPNVIMPPSDNVAVTWSDYSYNCENANRIKVSEAHSKIQHNYTCPKTGFNSYHICEHKMWYQDPVAAAYGQIHQVSYPFAYVTDQEDTLWIRVW